MQTILIAILSLGWTWSAALAQGDGMQVSTRFVVKDSGFPADARAWGLPIWLDNRRLLFEGIDLEATTRHPKREIHAATYIWDTETNTIQKYRDHRIFMPCYSDGVIHYKVIDRETKRRLIYEGPFGKERERPEMRGQDPVWNRYDCARFIGDEEPVSSLRKKGREIFALRREHGYVDVGSTITFRSRQDTAEFDYQMHAWDGKRATKLGISRMSSAWPIQWMPFSKRYLFDESSAAWTNRVWLVDVDGTAQSVSLPKRDWKYPTQVLGVDDGVVINIRSTFSAVGRLAGSQGLYLVSGKRLEWLLQGHVASLSVSPDGCSISFVQVPYTMALSDAIKEQRRGRVGHSIRMMHLCQVP